MPLLPFHLHCHFRLHKASFTVPPLSPGNTAENVSIEYNYWDDGKHNPKDVFIGQSSKKTDISTFMTFSDDC
ncbi:hypothetical protein PHYBLDRAFT_179739 [Phycomyces blakesleeanus NRRL 1555(-)]|uniref:Uncharacterized protein n=1 Tax=Phycomyces blakesleeanus (strain ATCC 8743b / DSM 1359 / FGSC 10004 / NBRC 33097 / NRRL 1555) TaxID=763407 RepID=A0A167Q1H9_PHYB8|nr:hypothetical protein PHYBLDRAFT_179739 [Phycomyces blakesleeanus NRRL 1555(-)]OAD78908.1 hypothetical protein PHYBLDRAFT_179739 [Phycomyces blakesleeanus NRRL 1555(-)]|eukprot:XP_018296948.1 hypothetical protein PHYBLDRAFT_179739 [Phycomyces blakesleeanus NRRL 1555(-)]